MLYFALVVSAILLAVAVGAFVRAKHPVKAVWVSTGAFVFAPLACAFFSPAVFFQALLLAVAAPACCVRRRRPRTFAAVAIGGTLAVYGAISWEGLHSLNRLRAEFPFVSMEGRLPTPKPSEGPLSASAAGRLRGFEWRLEQFMGAREDRLRMLHEDAVGLFVNQPGFGAGRLRAATYRPRYADMVSLPQPGPRAELAWSAVPEDLPLPTPPAGFREKLLELHEGGVVDFANPDGYGYFKDRRHVAGFQSHRFTQPPDRAPKWELRTLDLVGLVVHGRPVVYLSENLPRMDELREAPTRAPDNFETAGLAELRRGEDLYVRGTADGLRMLGSIRSAKHCVDCHGGERGDLLGAFSYSLTEAGR